MTDIKEIKKINLNDYFCNDFLDMLQKNITEKTIDIDLLKEHINNCSYCNNSILKFVKENISKINLFNLLKR